MGLKFGSLEREPFHMPLSRFALSATIAMFAVSSVASAQELFPLLDSAQTHESLPDTGTYEIKGFSLYMSPDEVKRGLDEFSATDYHIVEYDQETRGLRDRRGNKVEFLHGPIRTLIEKKDGFDRYQLVYASALHANRLHTMSYTTSFEQEVDLANLLETILTKYGEPSVREVNGNYGEELRYVYQDGALTDELADCEYTSNDVPAGHVHRYKFQELRENRHPTCNGEIAVNITYGARNDLAKILRIQMWDYSLYFEDLKAQDQFLLEALNAEIASKSGADAPVL